MKPRPDKSLSLVELLVALSLFTLIVLGFGSIDMFGRVHLLTSDRRLKLQNNVAFVVEHMAKSLSGTDIAGGAIGDINNYPVEPIIISVNSGIAIRVDSNKNGKLDGEDKQVAYIYSSADYQIWYYSDASITDSYDVLTGSHIRPDFSTTTTQPTYCSYNSSQNYIELQLTASWDPAGIQGTIDNPQIIRKDNLYMPSVSAY
jgi:Tfp pilus assembly protein PilW